MKGVAGAYTDILDAILVTGLPPLALSGITFVGAVATATLAVANATLRNGDWFTMAGAGGADAALYNGSYRITGYNGTTQFSYTMSGTPSAPASGTLTYAKTAAGWAIAFTAASKRVYRSPNVATPRHFFRVDDSTVVGNVREAYVRCYETMTDADTGVAPTPTVVQQANGSIFNKSITADATARQWYAFVSDYWCQIYVAVGGIAGSYAQPPYAFGHFITRKPSDAYNSCVGGGTAANVAAATSIGSTAFSQSVSSGAVTAIALCPLYIARAYNQTGGSIAGGVWDSGGGAAHQIGVTGAFAGGIAYPNGPDGALDIAPVAIVEFTGAAFHVRGYVPGMYAHRHAALPQSNGDLVTGVDALPGRTLIAINGAIAPSGSIILSNIHHDLTGPW